MITIDVPGADITFTFGGAWKRCRCICEKPCHECHQAMKYSLACYTSWPGDIFRDLPEVWKPAFLREWLIRKIEHGSDKP